MGTEDNPDIKIEYGSDTNVPPSSWTDLIADAVRFNVRDAGVLKVPVVNIELANKAGKYTSGSDALVFWRPIRIRADIRGVFDTIFYGRLYRTEGSIKGKKIPHLTLICRSLARKLLEDTITRPYYDMYTSGEQPLTMKQVIEDFLLNPDSGSNTGITLETDEGIITTTYAQHNFRQTTLQDALRDIGEKIDYDGYVYVDATNAIKLNLKKIGTVQTNPAITLNHPYVSVEPIFDIDEIKSHVFPWGDMDVGIPTDMDRWTEKDILTNWSSPYTGCTISEETTDYQIGKKCVKATRTNVGNIGALLTIPTEESPIDASTKYNCLFLFVKPQIADDIPYPYLPLVTLTDDMNNMIEWRSTQDALQNIWYQMSVPIGSSLAIYQQTPPYGRGAGRPNVWCLVESTQFNWHIKKVEVWTQSIQSGGILKVDGLFFTGARRIDPVEYSELQRTVPSFPYGRRVYHHEDSEIKSFAQAQAIADYIINVNEDIVKKFRAKVKAKTWAHVNEYLTFNLAEYGIGSELWRIAEIEHEWKRPKYLRTSLTLVPKDQFVGSQAYLADTIEGILKYR